MSIKQSVTISIGAKSNPATISGSASVTAGASGTFTAATSQTGSQAGDEDFLEAFSTAVTGLDTTWDGVIDLSSQVPTGVTTSTIGGEERVTQIDLRGTETGMGALSGDIDIPEWENLKECTLINIALNNFDTQYPSAIHKIGSKLEYLYLCYSNGSGNWHPMMPHEFAADGGNITGIHVGKSHGDETNNYHGSVPSDVDNLTGLKYYFLGWTDDWGAANTNPETPSNVNGISSVSENIWNINTLEAIYLYDNWNIGDSGNTFGFPNSIAHLTELKFIYLGGGSGTEYGDASTPYMTGSHPSDLDQLTKVRFYFAENEKNLSGFPDLRNCAPDLEKLSLPKTDTQGTMPAWMWDGRFTRLDVFSISFPQGDKMSGTFPAIDPDNHDFLDLFTITSHDFSGAVPAGLWGADISKVNIGQNNFTSFETTDLTSNWAMNMMWYYTNDIEATPIPNLDWSRLNSSGGPRNETLAEQFGVGTMGIRANLNRYVFQDMLYVPSNSPNGETCLELHWILDSQGVDIIFEDQRAAGPTNGYELEIGSSVTINDHENTYGHADNSYQWQKDGVNISDGSKYSGTTTKTLTISDFQSADAGTYELVVTNSTYASLASTYGKSNQTLRSRPITVTESLT